MQTLIKYWKPMQTQTDIKFVNIILYYVQLEDDIGYIKSSHTDLSSSN